MSKILVVEDDYFLRRDLKEILGRRGYEVLAAATGKEAVQISLQQPNIELYLLDVWLPDADGFSLCQNIRRKSNCPIVFLTACNDEESVIKGLDMGGDDYITKPFRSGELLARIQANLRRTIQREPEGRLWCEGVILHLNDGTLMVREKEESLRPVEYRLLKVLMLNAGRIVKRERLLELLWDEADNAVEDNTLNVHMSRLRAKLGNEYIETIRGFGYRFVREVHRL